MLERLTADSCEQAKTTNVSVKRVQQGEGWILTDVIIIAYFIDLLSMLQLKGQYLVTF